MDFCAAVRGGGRKGVWAGGGEGEERRGGEGEQHRIDRRDDGKGGEEGLSEERRDFRNP